MILQKVYYFQQMHAGSFNVKVLELYRKITSNKVFQRILLNMSFIDEVLQQPSYGWKNEKGDLVKPSLKQLYREAFSRINIFSTKKNWISLMSWVMTICLLPFLFFKILVRSQNLLMPEHEVYFATMFLICNICPHVLSIIFNYYLYPSPD